MTSRFNKILALLVATLFLLASCSLDTPQAPPNDNPWDPANPSPPRAPIGLSGQVLSETSVSLHWQDNSGNESGFLILEPYIWYGDNVDWRIVDSVAANSQTDSLTGLRPASEYNFMVVSWNKYGNSTPRLTFPASRKGLVLNTANSLPTPPNGVTLQHLNGLRVKVVWQDNSANETSFQIEQTVNQGAFQLAATLPADSTTWTTENLNPFETYSYRIRATNEFGTSPHAEGTPIQPGEVSLSTPYDVTAEALSETEVEVRWNDSNLVAESFTILQSLNDSLHFNHLATVGSDTLSIELASQLPNTSYFYRIVAQNRLANSSPSLVAHASTAETIPWPPSNFSARIDNELDVVLNWRDNSSNETGFELSESVNGDQPFATIAILPRSTTTITFPNCPLFVSRRYRLRAIGDFGNSPVIASATVTPGAFPPLSPTDLEVSVLGATEIRITWRDASKIELEYEIHEKSTMGDWYPVATVDSSVFEYSFVNRRPNSPYTYRVRAKNSFGNSAWLTSRQVTTPGPPQSPTGFSAEGVTSSQIDLSWSINGATHQGFILEDSLYGAETWRFVDSIKSPDVRTYQHGNATRHQRTHFRIKSYNQYGASGFSNIYGAMPYAKVAFVACSDAGIVAVDVTDPANPTEIRRLDTPGLAQRVFIENNRAYVADSYGGVEVCDISSPALMFEVGSYETYGRAYNLIVENSIAYIAAGDSGLEIVDLTNPASPQPLSRFATAPGIARGVAKIAGNLYVSTQDRGVLRLNVSNRRSPSLVNEIGSPSSSQGICVHHRNTHVMVAEYSAGVRVLTEYLEEFETIPLDGNSFDIVRGPSDYVIQYYVANLNRGVIALSINPNAAGFIISTLPMPDDTWGVAVAGLNLLLAAVDNAGLKLINIADSSNPSITSTFVTPGPARGIAIREYK